MYQKSRLYQQSGIYKSENYNPNIHFGSVLFDVKQNATRINKCMFFALICTIIV